MARLSQLPAAFVVLLAISGCATALRGGSQIVVISSEPSGATVSIDGAERVTTPAVVSLERRSPHTIGVRLDGYAPETRAVSTHADYKLVALNLLLFHPAIAAAGIGVDFLTGARNRLAPTVINVRLAISDSATVALGGSGVPWLPVPIGSLVRISTADSSAPMVIGTLTAVSGDTLLVHSVSSTESHSIARRSVGTMELSVVPDGRTGLFRWTWQGAIGGLAAGAAVGAIAEGGEGAYWGAFLYGAPIGLVLGTIAGALFPPNARWLPIR